jgi:hypothetical protein
MTAKESLELLKAHLAKKGFGDIEVNMTAVRPDEHFRGREDYGRRRNCL